MPRRTEYVREKDPDDVWPYGFDWTKQLPSGESVSTSTWSVTAPTGDTTPVIIDSDTISGNVTTVVLSAGTAGKTYQIQCRIVSTNAYTRDWTFDLICRQN